MKGIISKVITVIMILSSVLFANNSFADNSLNSKFKLDFTKSLSGNFRNVTYGNGIFVVVGNNGISATSKDGVEWTKNNDNPSINIRYSENYNDVIWTGVGFIAIGDSGSVVSSKDGLNWSGPCWANHGNTLNFKSIIFGKGIYITVGQDIVTGKGFIMTSQNGNDWDYENYDGDGELDSIACNGNTFVIVGHTEQGNQILLSSSDGSKWVNCYSKSLVGKYFNNVFYDGKKFIAIGGHENCDIITSSDGVNWIVGECSSYFTPYCGAWDGSEYFLLGSKFTLFTSVDSIKWVATNVEFDDTFISVLVHDKTIVAIGSSGSIYTDATNQKVNIVEKNNLKILVDGKHVIFKDCPISIKDKYYLSAVPLLSALGVKNDKAHINWNYNSKTLTINANNQKIVMQADNNYVNINNIKQMINYTPSLYNNILYIPVDFIASKFGRVTIEDNSSKSLFLRDTAGFNKVKTVIQKIKDNQNKYKKAKFKVTSGINNPEITSGEIDRKNNIMHFVSPFEMGASLEYFIKNNTVFFCYNDREKNSTKGDKKWGYFDIGGNKLADSFNIPINYSDTMSAGLTLSKDKKNNQLILEGDIYIDEFYKRPVTYYDMSYWNDIKTAHSKLIFDSKTFFMKSGILDVTYFSDYYKALKKDKISFIFSDYNSSSIKIPIDKPSKDIAKNFKNTLIGSGFEYFQDYVEK